jgi:hypothetical protein
MNSWGGIGIVNGSWNLSAVASGPDQVALDATCIPYSALNAGGFWSYAYAAATTNPAGFGLQASADTAIGDSGISFINGIQGYWLPSSQGVNVGGVGVQPTVAAGAVCASGGGVNGGNVGCPPIVLPAVTNFDFFLNLQGPQPFALSLNSYNPNPNGNCPAWVPGCYTMVQSSCNVGGGYDLSDGIQPPVNIPTCTPPGVDNSGGWFCGFTVIKRAAFPPTSGTYNGFYVGATGNGTPQAVSTGPDANNAPQVTMTCVRFPDR